LPPLTVPFWALDLPQAAFSGLPAFGAPQGPQKGPILALFRPFLGSFWPPSGAFGPRRGPLTLPRLAFLGLRPRTPKRGPQRGPLFGVVLGPVLACFGPPACPRPGPSFSPSLLGPPGPKGPEGPKGALFSAVFGPFFGLFRLFCWFSWFSALQQGRLGPSFRALRVLAPGLGPFGVGFRPPFGAPASPGPGPSFSPSLLAFGLRPPAEGRKKGAKRAQKGPLLGPFLGPFGALRAQKGALWPSGPPRGPLGPRGPEGPFRAPFGGPQVSGPGFVLFSGRFSGRFWCLFWPSVLLGFRPVGPGFGCSFRPLFWPLWGPHRGPKRPVFGPQNHRFSSCFAWFSGFSR